MMFKRPFLVDNTDVVWYVYAQRLALMHMNMLVLPANFEQLFIL